MYGCSYVLTSCVLACSGWLYRRQGAAQLPGAASKCGAADPRGRQERRRKDRLLRILRPAAQPVAMAGRHGALMLRTLLQALAGLKNSFWNDTTSIFPGACVGVECVHGPSRALPGRSQLVSNSCLERICGF
jgi:hypothetical protein